MVTIVDLGQTRARNWELHLVSLVGDKNISIWGVWCFLLRCINRKLDQKQSCYDLNP